MAPFMFVAAVGVEFIVAIKPLVTKAAFGMSFEPTLVYCAWLIISMSLVSSKLIVCEQLMFVRENFLIPRAQITIR